MDIEEDADDPVAGPSTPKVAKIWKYFKKDLNKSSSSKCNYCDKSLCTPTGTTSTLSRHLKAVHPVQFAAYFKDVEDDKGEKIRYVANNLQLHLSDLKRRRAFLQKAHRQGH